MDARDTSDNDNLDASESQPAKRRTPHLGLLIGLTAGVVCVAVVLVVVVPSYRQVAKPSP